MKYMMFLLLLLMSVIVFSENILPESTYTVGVITHYSTATEHVFNDAKKMLDEYLEYGQILFLQSATEATSNVYVELYLGYDATNNIYKATYIDGNYKVTSQYSPGGFKKYSTFLKEIIYYPLEKIALYRFKTGDFGKYLRLTYHPGVDEYGDYSPEKGLFFFITDRLAGNRNIAYMNFSDTTINILAVFGSSEYFPKLSPDGSTILFQGSLHGFWNIYTMPFSPDYYKKIRLVSSGNKPAYGPTWYDENTVLYSQDTKTKNEMLMKSLKGNFVKPLKTYGEMSFTPFVHNGEIYYTALHGANFGIYKLVDGTNTVVEDTFFNEHDPVVTPDGSYLVFTSNRDGIYRIWMKDLSTGSVTCLTPDIPYDVFYPETDGKYVFFSVYKEGEEPDIYVRRLERK
ncbi:PD40 domain-containing protein [Thermosipho ferrireducens]|uniref:PD40 domain-containing protein n=1 Tax=Thermosipho ferrireducens TaxID=2571116 RepID=A0ABX7S7R4_9BACT|nr:PD40 domain-containing protein [Thermosipho ferrireducens]QTA37850.1 PD40 domain-containing protein [Thermosipho ferrireducens]